MLDKLIFKSKTWSLLHLLPNFVRLEDDENEIVCLTWVLSVRLKGYENLKDWLI